MGLARGGLYKYVTSKEEIFLMIYLQKQDALLLELVERLNNLTLSKENLAKTMSEVFFKHLDFIKYHQILNAIIETNVTIERLAEFKLASHKQMTPLFNILECFLNKNRMQVFDLYLTILYHCVYLYDRVAYQSNYVKAMKLANLEIDDIDFVKHLSHFIFKILA